MTRDRSDCTVRALVAVTGADYATVYALLKSHGRRDGAGFNLGRWLACQCRPVLGEPEYVLGWDTVYRTYPAVRGQKRLTAATFAARYSHGRFILNQAHHVCAVVDGRVAMEERHDGACVYASWAFVAPSTPPLGPALNLHDSVVSPGWIA